MANMAYFKETKGLKRISSIPYSPYYTTTNHLILLLLVILLSDQTLIQFSSAINNHNYLDLLQRPEFLLDSETSNNNSKNIVDNSELTFSALEEDASSSADSSSSSGGSSGGSPSTLSKLGKQSKVQTLYIAGLFPMTGTGGWIGGSGCLPAAMMALDDVNAREDLLPGYKLELNWKDSQCNPGKAARFMYDLIYYPPKKVILVCGCSTVCSIVAESANMWNLIVIGYGASSPALSDRSRFPTFFRTHPSATIHNPTRIKLFEKYGWSRVAIVLETEEVFIETARDLEQRCRLHNIQLLTRVSFVRQPADAMDNLKRADPRIIVGMFYKQQARRVMCEAYKRGLYGEKYVWFLIGWYEDDWWTDVKDLDCTIEQMKLAVEGHITTEGLVLNQDNRRTISGYTSKDWLRRYQFELSRQTSVDQRLDDGAQGASLEPAASSGPISDHRLNIVSLKDSQYNFSASESQQLQQQQQQEQRQQLQPTNGGATKSTATTLTSRPEGFQEAPLAYDAIWAIALALNTTIRDLDRQQLSIGQFNYTMTPRIRDVFLDNLRQTNFLGVSGEVAFSDIGDRIAWTQIEQMNDGNYTVIGYFDTRTSKLNFNESRIRWPRGEPPKDRTIIKELVEHLSLPFMLPPVVISLVGIVASALLIYFNWSCREDVLIKMSHPPSNNIMLFGCMICLISVVLFGLDGRFIPASQFHLICDLRAWCLNLGFSLFFGSMFWKVWRSYVLSTRGSAAPIAPGGQKKAGAAGKGGGGGGGGVGGSGGGVGGSGSGGASGSSGGASGDNQVFYMVGLFCLVDIVVLIIWKIREPMDRTTVKIREHPGRELNMGDDVIVELKIEYCQANFYWYYLIYCYKGLLLVFGLFLAYETRSVKLRHLNDSKLVGLCIYNVSVLCFITGPISLVNLMRQQANYHFIFVSFSIILSCSLSMILIFIPKVLEYMRRRRRRGPGSMLHSIQEERSSRDDEEQYNKLERENRELAEKIREKDSQMKAMIARIEEARENANKNLEPQRQQQHQAGGGGHEACYKSASGHSPLVVAASQQLSSYMLGPQQQQQQQQQLLLRGRRGISRS